MGKYIELIGQLKPKNGGTFPIADVNDLKGGYIQLEKIAELATLPESKLKEGMLAYVSESNEIYQYRQEDWGPWKGGSGDGTGGAGVKKVLTLKDLNDDALKFAGQIIFVEEIKDLRYYDGVHWKSFSRIYIQATPPEDTGGIWIDTSDDTAFKDSNQTIQNLVQVISILQKQVRRLEWAMDNQLDFGDFTNNHYSAYDEHPTPVEPSYGTDVESDEAELVANLLRTTEEIEPTEYKEEMPNGTHLCIKSGSYAQMVKNQDGFLPKELLWVEDRRELWIKDPRSYKLIKIGSTTGGGDDPLPPGTDPETMKQIITELVGKEDKIVGINFGDMANLAYDYQLRVVNGKIVLHDLSLDKQYLNNNSQIQTKAPYYDNAFFPINSANNKSPMIYMNSIYTGGKGGPMDYNPCSHNFVEIVNLAAKDSLNLNGLFLHYTEKSTGFWVTLPLYGLIKPNETFLIRGAQCSVRDVNTTKIKVDTFDMEWTKEASYNVDVLETTDDNIWDSNNRIQFSNNCAFYITSEPETGSFKTTPLKMSAPWSSDSGEGTNGRPGVGYGYIDLMGIGTFGGKSMPSEKENFPVSGPHVLYHRSFTMDFVTQAISNIGGRSNSSEWTYIDLVNTNPRIRLEDYTPKASFEYKDLFYNKNVLVDGAPNIITCSFGQDAHKTRCFNWVSKGYYDEFIWFSYIKGVYNPADMFESFKKGDGRPSNNRFHDNKIYDRVRSMSSDGTSFTAHKFIKDFFVEEGQTERTIFYKVGRNGAWSEERSFTLRTRESVIENGFNFLHHSDQQGFTEEEYETWRIAAEYIEGNSDNPGHSYDWSVNTGDATQNGNRINEWLDYFNFGDPMFRHKEQMYTVGNNDLAPKETHTLGRGSDFDKINPVNTEFFFTNEHPDGIPVTEKKGIYVPCVYSFVYGDTYFLSVNSEITSGKNGAITLIYDEPETRVNVYTVQMQNWCSNDIEKYGTDAADPKIKWRVVLTHEAPFTMVTADEIKKFNENSSLNRGGSHLNTVGDYWLSRFLDKYKVHMTLCGHKHTFSNSRYMRDNVHEEDPTLRKSMVPTIYDKNYIPADGETPAVYPSWYTALNADRKKLVELSNDKSIHYVRHIMSQATGYKLVSNKTLPAQYTPWFMNYYPITREVWDSANKIFLTTPNPAQLFPHYIRWNIGKGTETEKSNNGTVERPRIKGNSYKLAVNVGDHSIPAIYNYNIPYEAKDLIHKPGNGSQEFGSGSADDNIIIEKIQ